jgi:hypothetical protein
MQAQADERRDWRALLAKLVRAGEAWQFPLKAYCPRPPSRRPWPKGLPSSPSLRDIYGLCDGGVFGGLFGWLRLRELKPAAKDMTEQVRVDRDFFPIEQQPFVLGRHLVLAKDSNDFPLVWDSDTNLLAWYQPPIDGGLGWNPLDVTLEAYLHGLFFPGPGATFVADVLWLEALRQLEAPSKFGG